MSKDIKKDPEEIITLLWLLPLGFMFAFWAYVIFNEFSENVWIVYLTNSAHISINIDYGVLVALFVINFLSNRFLGDTEVLKYQLVYLIEKMLSSILLVWTAFDLFYKMDILGAIQRVLLGNSSTVIPVNGVSFFSYQHAVGALAIGTAIAPLAVIWIGVYIASESKTNG